MNIDYNKLPLRYILCVDVKSFFASVEAVRRGIDPLEAYIIVVSGLDRPGGIVLASSPKVKAEFGIKTGNRKFEIPPNDKLMLVNPSMSLYLEFNRKIHAIFQDFAADEDIVVYSIDESLLDITSTAHLFGYPWQVAELIRDRIKQELGLAVTIGIGDNPLLAKLALDNEAKKNQSQIAYWSYESIPETVWKIPKLTDFWGISRGYEKRFNKLGIYSIYSLAHFNPEILKSKFGIMGLQQYYHANGVDYSILRDKVEHKSKGFSKGQILMRDYSDKADILTILMEMTEDLALRLRHHHYECRSVAIYCGYSSNEAEFGFSVSKKLSAPTAGTKALQDIFTALFEKNWSGQKVRQFNLSLNDVEMEQGHQMSFWEIKEFNETAELDHVLDEIKDRFGLTSIFKGHSLTKGSTLFQRSKNVGGHQGMAEVE